MSTSTSTSFSFDRLVGVVVVLLLLLVMALVWQTQGQKATPTATKRTDQQYIVYSAVDEQGIEQLFAISVTVQASNIITGVAKQLSHEQVGIWDFSVSPFADQILYAALTSKGNADLWLTTPLSQTPTLLVSCPDGACSSSAWAKDGRLVAYSRRNATSSGTATLNPPRLWMIDTLTGESAAVFSDTQKLAFEPRWSSDSKWLSYLSPDFVGVGVMNLESGATQFFETPSGEPAVWRPAHPQIVLTVQSQISDTWVTNLVMIDVGSGEKLNLSGETLLVEDSSPVWTPDGEQLIFRRRIVEGAGRSLSKQIWKMRADGSEAQPLTNEPDFEHDFVSMAPAGNYVVFHKFPLKGPNVVLSVWALNLATGQQTEIARPGQRPKWLP